MSHGMPPGLVVAALVGAPLLLGAAGGVLLAAAGIALVARDERLGGDVGVAVCVSALFGLGAMLALSPAAPPRLAELLFGDLLGVTAADLAAAGALAVGVGLALAAGSRPLALAAFERASAPSLGARPARCELAPPRAARGHDGRGRAGAREPVAVRARRRPGGGGAARREAPAHACSLASVALAALAGVAGLLVSFHLRIATGAAVGAVRARPRVRGAAGSGPAVAGVRRSSLAATPPREALRRRRARGARARARGRGRPEPCARAASRARPGRRSGPASRRAAPAGRSSSNRPANRWTLPPPRLPSACWNR